MIDTIHIAVCMKPIDGNFAQNAREHGVSGLNIDSCRIEMDIKSDVNYRPNAKSHNKVKSNEILGKRDASAEVATSDEGYHNSKGRFPANVILDGSDEVTEQFPTSNQNGYRANPSIKRDQHSNQVYGKYQDTYTVGERGYDDEGSASRFFKECPSDD